MSLDEVYIAGRRRLPSRQQPCSTVAEPEVYAASWVPVHRLQSSKLCTAILTPVNDFSGLEIEVDRTCLAQSSNVWVWRMYWGWYR